MRISLFLAFAGALAAAAGCVGIQSVPNDDGIVYHLPRTLLTITVVKYRDTASRRTWYQIGTLKNRTGEDDNAPELAEIESTSIPDPGHRYVAHYNPNPFSDDRLCVSRSPTGLLQDVNFASDDRTPQIFFNIARFIAGSLGGARKTGASTRGGEGTLEWELHTGRVDPLEPDSLRRFNESMGERFGENLRLDVTELNNIFDKYKPKLPHGCRSAEDCPAERWTDRCARDNICYRTQLQVPIGLMRAGRHVDTNYARVINPLDIGAISVSRAFLVHKISKFKFDNGVLLGAVIRKPSEVEELALLPLNLIYAALYTPSAALATAFGTDDAAKKAVAQDFADLTQKVNENTSKVNMLEGGLGMGASVDLGTEVYKLTCAAPKPDKGSLINLVTGADF